MKILITDDHPMLAAGLKGTLEHEIPGYDYLTCTNLTDAKKILFGGRGTQVLLVICDLRLGPESGAELLTYMQVLPGPRIPVVMLSGLMEQAAVNSCKGLGAKGYVSKTDNPEVLTQAIRTILAGGEFFPSWDNKCTSQFLDRALKMTERQRAVMDLAISALSNKEIARHLAITEGTVKNYLREIYGFLNVKNRTDFSVQAAKCGYTPRTVPASARV
ncbi:response regulator transcription factor [Noviherbaspirillum sp. L7-7A]|uniref:response regulator transcription factor n=1 Tax=Noviherbaspirillum sp. L7-7A TaxID=2850560 RepID=UPI001C2CA870|nr:response regulator transcription factor [Noviherbaspirillum sp. L7-7A]MBV0881618.1 response regulator transcription factor [Noviherbaspirillum sp. L7-7A]